MSSAKSRTRLEQTAAAMTGLARSKPAALLRLISRGAFTWTWLQEAALASAGFLTPASRLHHVSFYGHADQYDTCFTASFFFSFQNTPFLPPSLPLCSGDTKQSGSSPPEESPPPHPPSPPQQQSSNPISSQTCSARNSSPEALQTPQLSPYSWRDFPLISADNKPCALLQLPKVGDGWRCLLIPPPPSPRSCPEGQQCLGSAPLPKLMRVGSPGLRSSRSCPGPPADSAGLLTPPGAQI